MTTIELATLSDEALLAETKRVAEVERRSMAELLALLIEVDRRHLCPTLGYSSLFAYCTGALGLSAQAAYSRITAARAVERIPAMLPMLADGALTLSSVGLLAPHLTEANQDALLSAAQHQSTRSVQKLLACAHPQPDIASSVRLLPAARSEAARPLPAESAVASQRSVVAPLSSKRYLLKVTISQEAHDHLQRSRDLLRHVIPDGDPATIVERALALLVKDAERTKCAATGRPRRTAEAARPTESSPQNPPSPTLSMGATPSSSTRRIPAAVKRAVWNRDGGRCAFVGTDDRCAATGFLEFHHVVPFAAGGATDLGNLQLRCRPHNAHEARTYFGAELGQTDQSVT